MSPISIFIVSILLTATVGLSTGASIAKRATTTAITYNQFLGIQIGWTLNQTAQYLNNNAGLVVSETEVAGMDILTVEYTSSYPIGVLILILTNNQLTAKSQSGLNQNQYPITRPLFDKITMGMTRAQVTAVVGNEGQILSQATNSVTIYNYNGNSNPFSTAQITFTQGLVMSKIAVLF